MELLAVILGINAFDNMGTMPYKSALTQRQRFEAFHHVE
jgi:hypothetical protein